MKLSEISGKLKNSKKNNHFLILFLACGILLMLFPSSSEQVEEKADSKMSYSVEKEEKRLESILSSIHGVGKCRVLLSVQNGEETILAEDNGETVVLSGGGQQSIVSVQTRYPQIQGAIIVSGGCDDPSVRFDILSSVMAYTGLGADRITICPIKD